MGHIPAHLFSALSDDIQQACNYDYESLLSLPSLPPDADHVLAASYSLARSFTKKLLPSDSAEQDKVAEAKFRMCNSHCETWQLRLNTSSDEEIYGSFKQELYNFFYPRGMPLVESLDHIYRNGKCGPGSSIGAPNGDFYSKMFSSRLSCTSQGLVKHYQSMISGLPLWDAGEKTRQASLGDPLITQSSRLSFVPKNDKTSRVICTEPVLNMYYQLGLGQILTRRLQNYFAIDLSKQPDLNRDIAWLGSKDGSWSTIDLESASDTISMTLLKEVLPPDVMSYITLLRCRKTLIRGDMVDLNMVSTMGNGFTFPLQTVIFASAVRAVYSSLNIKERVNVFGDDIAVLTASYHRLVRFLTLLGFKVNTDKSFSEGPFRESCGRDYFSGREIRGVYVQRFETQQDKYALINALNDFSAKTGILLSRTVRYILGLVDRNILVPRSSDAASGIRVPLSMITPRRLDKRLQADKYMCYVFVPQRIRILDGFIRSRKGKKIIYNPDGLFVAFLGGMALSSGLPLRDEGRWKKKRRCCSFWDSFESDLSPVRRGFSWQQWETAVELNFIV